MPSYSTQDANPTTEFSYPDGYLFHYTNEHGPASPALFPPEPKAITYTPFHSVRTITEGNNSLSIQYGPDRQRSRMVTDPEGLTTTTLYGRNYERVTSGSEVKHYHYIGSPTGLAAILLNGQIYFPLSDHLGSITGLVSSTTYALLEEYSYDACYMKHWFCEARAKPDVELIPTGTPCREGRRRNPSDWSYINVPVPVYLTRGYTGHSLPRPLGEHLDLFGLINMNGRMYDPILARFLSVDPYVQAADYTQSYNRYSYCLNNPLIYTDPSGYTPQHEWDIERNMRVNRRTHMMGLINSGAMDDAYINATSRNPHSYSYNGIWLKQGLGQEADKSSNSGIYAWIVFGGTREKPYQYIIEVIFKSRYSGDGQANLTPGLGRWAEYNPFEAFRIANRIVSRIYIPDRVSISATGNIAIFKGVGLNLELNWILRGKDASILPYITNTITRRTGLEGDAGIQLNAYWFPGPVDEISKDFLYGPTKDFDAGFGYGGSIYISQGKNGEILWFGAGSGIGLTLGASYGNGHTSQGINNHPLF